MTWMQNFGISKNYARISVTCVLSALFITACNSTAPLSKNTEDGSGAYATGKYRNLFLEAGYSQKEIDDKLLGDMVHREPITGMVRGRMSRVQTVGKEVNDEHAMILFSPDSMRNNITDPSYHLPAFYELWSRWGPKEDSDFWKRAVQSSRGRYYGGLLYYMGLLHCTRPVQNMEAGIRNFFYV